VKVWLDLMADDGSTSGHSATARSWSSTSYMTRRPLSLLLSPSGARVRLVSRKTPASKD